MLKFKHLFKGIFKDRIHSILNIIGFATGLACSIIVFLYVQNALTYEKHFNNHERIYRYGVNMTIGGRNSTQTSCNNAVGPLLFDYMSGIEEYARTTQFGEMLVKKGDVSFSESDFHFADSGMFKVFNYDIIYGGKKIDFKDPNQIVLTESTSKKYFGDKNPMGEIMELEQYGNFEVVAVMADLRKNSIIQFDALLSLETLLKDQNLEEIYSPRLLSSGMTFKTYFLFKSGYLENDFLNEFQNFYNEYMAEFDGFQYKSVVEPIAEIYLNSRIWTDWSAQNRRFLFGFISIGAFILILACINYINMASSNTISRAKEIAIKKVLGSSKTQLILQLLFESVALCFIALLIAFALAEFILIFTPFNEIIGTEISLKASNFLLISSSILLSIIVGVLSGLFPALLLAGTSPSKSLYGKNNSILSKGLIRNVLISIQLTISIAAIILSLLMKTQVNFLLNKDLGFDKENLIVMRINDDDVRKKIKSLKDELIQYHGIQSVSFSSATPGYSHNGYAFNWESNTGEMEVHAFRDLSIDANYFEILNIEIVQGESFTRERTENDSIFEFLVNEKLVAELGWDEPIGKRNQIGMVIGVVKDYNYGSLHGEIRPMYIYQNTGVAQLFNIKLSGINNQETIKYIKSLWQKHMPGYDLNYNFLDEKIAFFYEEDLRQKKLSNIFSFLCIIISSLGLFSMISLANARKVKEVAIRKVHGASILQILLILYKNTFYLLVIASLVAIPIVWKIFSMWLQNYPYKVGFSILPYLISIIGALIISLTISVSYSMKVARSNPVDSLRYE
jgi:putative ABC transport system permease protein